MSRSPLEANVQLPEITQPVMAPAALIALIEEFGEQNRQGNWPEAVARLRDIAGFSTRYFAGVAQAAGRELHCLGPAESSGWSQTATVSQAVELLQLCLARLATRSERLARKFYQIFYDRDHPRSFALTLGLVASRLEEIDPNESGSLARSAAQPGLPLVVTFCQSGLEHEDELEPELVQEVARALDGWMMATFSFFLECEQRFESGNFFGQLEHAVQFEQYLLRTGLSVRVRESRTPSLQLTLAPDSEPEPEAPAEQPVRSPSGRLSMFTGVKLPRFASGRFKKPVAPEPAPAEEAVSFAGTDSVQPLEDEPPTVQIKDPLLLAELRRKAALEALSSAPKTSSNQREPQRPPAPAQTESDSALMTPMPSAPSVPTESVQPLTQLLDQMLQQTPVLPASKADSSEAPRPQVEVHIDHLGYLKNAQGRLGYGGHLWIRNAGEGELSGSVVSHHESVQIAPNLISGNENKFIYWVDPDQSGSSGGHIEIKTVHEQRLVPTWRLMPRSYFAGLSRSRLALLLLAPGLLGTLYCVVVFLLNGLWTDHTLHTMLGARFDRYLSPANPLSLRGAGVGELDLQILPRIEASMLLFYLLSWAVPTLVCKLYQSLPRHSQLELSTLFTFSLVLPSALFAGLAYTPLSTGATYIHPELSSLDFRQHLLEFVALNLLGSSYYYLEVAGLWGRYLNRLGRFVFSLLCFALFAGALVYLVYGRSWLGVVE